MKECSINDMVDELDACIGIGIDPEVGKRSEGAMEIMKVILDGSGKLPVCIEVLSNLQVGTCVGEDEGPLCVCRDVGDIVHMVDVGTFRATSSHRLPEADLAVLNDMDWPHIFQLCLWLLHLRQTHSTRLGRRIWGISNQEREVVWEGPHVRGY